MRHETREGAQDAQGAQLDEQVKNITKQLGKVEGAQGAHHFRQKAVDGNVCRFRGL